MAPVFRSIARLVTAMTIVFGVRPRVVSLLDVLQRPSVHIVSIARRRRLEYAAWFITTTDPEACDEVCTYPVSTQPGLGASQHTPFHRPAKRTYTPVRSA